jgi:hypothetical protein
MSLAVSIFELVSAVALTVGVLVGVVQLRQHAMRRRREATLELAHSFQTPEMTNPLSLVISRGEGLALDQLRELAGGDARPLIAHLCTNSEALSALVYAGELDLDLVRTVFGGSVTRSWAVLRPLLEELRQRRSWPRLYEWFQWLAERIEEREACAPREPAYGAFRDWDSAVARRVR